MRNLINQFDQVLDTNVQYQIQGQLLTAVYN